MLFRTLLPVPNSLFSMARRAGGRQRPVVAVVALAIVLGVTMVVTPSASAQTFTVLHTFTGGGDGALPGAGLTMDEGGNFFGSTESGGAAGPNSYGTVFKLSHTRSGWSLNPLYSFAGNDDGASPAARVVIGPDGTLYGTTSAGGSGGCGGGGCGTIFSLRPPTNAPTNALTDWSETVLYRFTGGVDGAFPVGDLVFDQDGNISAGSGGGSSQMGTVYALTPSDGGWTQNVLWTFSGGKDGGRPAAGVIFDSAGNLYGTTQIGGVNGFGSVFQLAAAGSSWSQSTVYSFQNGSDGANPVGGLIFDSSGNLYGTTTSKGQGQGGTVFALTRRQNGAWAFSVLYAFAGQSGNGPRSSLTMDAAGNLYGTTYKDGAYGSGSAFKLIPFNDGWTYTDLHDFTSGSDGAQPASSLVLDASGNVYGTALAAGGFDSGIVFEITPLLITTDSLPVGTVNTPYSATLSATGGLPPYTWRIIKGSLPTGLSLDANRGVISGVPKSAGTSNFSVQVSDSESPPATTSALLSITIQSQLLIATSSLPPGTVNIPYSATLTATGGLPPYTWSLTSGSLPAGLSLDANSGLISGTPKTPGTSRFTVQVSDSQSPPASASEPLSITVNAHSVFLSWDASSSQDVIGYNAYRGTNSGGPYINLNSCLIATTSYTDRTVQSGYTYYYVTTAVDSLGLESAYSNQAIATVP